jgi:hypothetical protein
MVSLHSLEECGSAMRVQLVDGSVDARGDIKIDTTFMCPICHDTIEINAGCPMRNCCHILCWQCRARMMMTNGSVNLACPLCRSQEVSQEASHEVSQDTSDTETTEGEDEPIIQTTYTFRIRHSTVNINR